MLHQLWNVLLNEVTANQSHELSGAHYVVHPGRSGYQNCGGVPTDIAALGND